MILHSYSLKFFTTCPEQQSNSDSILTSAVILRFWSGSFTSNSSHFCLSGIHDFLCPWLNWKIIVMVSELPRQCANYDGKLARKMSVYSKAWLRLVHAVMKILVAKPIGLLLIDLLNHCANIYVWWVWLCTHCMNVLNLLQQNSHYFGNGGSGEAHNSHLMLCSLAARSHHFSPLRSVKRYRKIAWETQG